MNLLSGIPMKQNGFEELDTEMLTWGGQRLSFEDANMDFYFEDDKLTAVNWGCHFCNLEA
ncbi:MAG: hypothetical protein U5L09_05500 [Bacteroidales bacterium]|nr:hypothetical protein [Bacteroidales bacterium]